MKKNIYKQSFWEFGHSFLQTASCCLLGKVFLGFMETFQGVLFHQITLAWKEFTGSHLWKQKQNLFSLSSLFFFSLDFSSYLFFLPASPTYFSLLPSYWMFSFLLDQSGVLDRQSNIALQSQTNAP